MKLLRAIAITCFASFFAIIAYGQGEVVDLDKMELLAENCESDGEYLECKIVCPEGEVEWGGGCRKDEDGLSALCGDVKEFIRIFIEEERGCEYKNITLCALLSVESVWSDIEEDCEIEVSINDR